MTIGGIAFLAISWGVIIGFNALCLRWLVSDRTGAWMPKSPTSARTSDPDQGTRAKPKQRNAP